MFLLGRVYFRLNELTKAKQKLSQFKEMTKSKSDFLLKNWLRSPMVDRLDSVVLLILAGLGEVMAALRMGESRRLVAGVGKEWELVTAASVSEFVLELEMVRALVLGRAGLGLGDTAPLEVTPGPEPCLARSKLRLGRNFVLAAGNLTLAGAVFTSPAMTGLVTSSEW